MTTLLLCGYRFYADSDSDSDSLGQPILGLSQNAQGKTQIERRIAELRSFGSPVICVLAGASADEQLRMCPRLADVELAYDNHGKNVTLMTNLLTGIEQTRQDSYMILPVEVPCPDRQTWNWLVTMSESTAIPEKSCLIQAVTAQGAPWHFGFPLILTRSGQRRLRRFEELTSLADPRLNTWQVVRPNLEVSDQQEVASSPKAI